ncbi:YnbE family lipoprotein [Azospirillum sp. YIM B02556]|uniref:YnbE family lipoprotein n=1 Tax=Azospirillum endophyticum TaxID=2800326 RepID=A0ABS1FEI9_9PROT|nr:YnbE family lipoprotein [Azospirillum endophyticum]MBK1841758.1 YnbE family lipoprotein [Azospirillum endophyticum]
MTATMVIKLPPAILPSPGLTAALLISAVLAACAPTVKIEAPDKPIEINLNVRIEQEVRVKLERDVDDAIRNDPALFGLPTDSAPSSTKGKK